MNGVGTSLGEAEGQTVQKGQNDTAEEGTAVKGMGAGLWSFLRAVGTPGVSNGAGQAPVVGNRAWAPSLQPVGVGRALAGPWVLGGWFCLGPCMSLAYSVHWGRGLDGWWQTAGSQAKRGPDRHHQPPFTNWLQRKENPIFLSRCFQMAAHWDSASHPGRNRSVEESPGSREKYFRLFRPETD